MSRLDPIVKKRGQSWQVDFGWCYRDDGTKHRRRETYPTKAEADREAKAHKKALRIDRKNTAVNLDGYTKGERLDIVNAKDVAGNKCTLTEAVKYYLSHAPRADSVTCSELLEVHLDEKRMENLRPRSITDAEGKIRRFNKTYGARGVHEITTKNIKAWFRSQKFTPETFNQYRAQLHSFFNCAINNECRESNPVTRIPKATTDEKTTRLLTPAQTRKLLASAQDHEKDGRSMVPYFAICLWAGLRPECEAQQIDWQYIDLVKKHIYIPAEIAKGRRKRYVKMSSNLVAWLKPYRQDFGKVYFYKRMSREIRDATKIEWQRDITRHTYASMHYATHDNADLTRAQLGHNSESTLFEHYREVVTKEDARKFWDIKPKSAKAPRRKVA